MVCATFPPRIRMAPVPYYCACMSSFPFFYLYLHATTGVLRILLPPPLGIATKTSVKAEETVRFLFRFILPPSLTHTHVVSVQATHTQLRLPPNTQGFEAGRKTEQKQSARPPPSSLTPTFSSLLLLLRFRFSSQLEHWCQRALFPPSRIKILFPSSST